MPEKIFFTHETLSPHKQTAPVSGKKYDSTLSMFWPVCKYDMHNQKMAIPFEIMNGKKEWKKNVDAHIQSPPKESIHLHQSQILKIKKD